MDLSVGEAHQTDQPLFTGFVCDLTERQQTERRLHELQDGLLHVSRVRSMGEIAAALAHELNQPLTATSNYVRAALRLLAAPEPDLAQVRQAMIHAVEQTLRSGEIIRRLRAFVARGELAREYESIAKLIEEASGLALVGAKERGVKVMIKMDPELPDAPVGRVQIQQVLLNLIRNAMEAMDGGRVQARRSRAGERDGYRLRSPSRDRGETLPALCHDEGRGHGNRPAHISRTIIEAHGGRLWMEPNTAGGSVFHFTLPTV
jgi:two-component system, LuxR family, sensor kinase FixL